MDGLQALLNASAGAAFGFWVAKSFQFWLAYLLLVTILQYQRQVIQELQHG